MGNTYTSSHKGGSPDRLTITEMIPNERFGFHVVMPNKWELQHEMTASAQGEGTLVTRSGKITKIPALMAPLKLLIAIVGPMDDKKLLNSMKIELEGDTNA